MKKLLTLAMIGFALNSYSQLNNGLQGCYPMDCDSAKNFAPPGSILNGSINNVTCTTGHTGVASTAYEFGGNTTSYITLPASSLLKPTAITVSGWYYIDTVTVVNGAYVVFNKSSCISNQEAYVMCVSGGKFIVAKSGNTTPYCQRDILTGPTVVANKWYHVVFSIDNSSIKLFVDCVNAYSMPTSIGWDYVAGKRVILGGSQESVDAPFKGRMDNLRFYDRLLTSAEICSLFKNDPRCQYDGNKEVATSLAEVMGGNELAGIEQNVPNPFNDNTVISYNTPSEFSKAQIMITTIDGKLIKALGITTHGEGTVNLEAGDLAKGFYMYSLIVDGKVLETRKMIKE